MSSKMGSGLKQPNENCVCVWFTWNEFLLHCRHFCAQQQIKSSDIERCDVTSMATILYYHIFIWMHDFFNSAKYSIDKKIRCNVHNGNVSWPTKMCNVIYRHAIYFSIPKFFLIYIFLSVARRLKDFYLTFSFSFRILRNCLILGDLLRSILWISRYFSVSFVFGGI